MALINIDLKSLKGYRTYIAAALTAVFGALAAVDWGGVFNGHPEGGYTAIILSIVFALMRSFTTTPPLQATPSEGEDKPKNS